MGANRARRLSNRLHLARLVLPLLACLLAVELAAAEGRGYALDEDPVRLGFKALEAGRLGDARREFLRAIADEYQVHRATFGLATIAEREGQLAEAEPLYREALRLRSGAREGYPEASAGLGLLLLRLDRDREAEPEFERALAGDDRLWTAHYGKASLLLRQGKLPEARRHLELGKGVKGLAAGEDLYHHGMALLHLADQDLDQAEREALLALHINPGDPANGELLGRIYEQRNTPSLAIDAYERAMATPGRTPTAAMLHTLGRLYEKDGRYNEARERYLGAMAADSTYAPAPRDLALLFRLADQHEQAARCYLRYLTLAPDDVDALLNLADSCYEIGQFAQGVSAATTARRLAPERLDAAFALARCGIHAREQDRRAEAAALMTALPDSLAWQVRDFVALAAHYGESGQLAEAGVHLERALARQPEAAELHYQLGLVRLKEGRLPEAIAALGQAAALDPQSPTYLINLGIAHFQAGDYLAAIPAFKRALDRNPELAVGRLLLAQAYAVSDSLAAAKEQYTRVLAAEPANAKALRGLGYCHIRQARYADALAAYRRATEADPRDADGWAGLGNAHLGLGALAAARSAYDRARSLDPHNATMKKGLELLEQAERDRASDD